MATSSVVLCVCSLAVLIATTFVEGQENRPPVWNPATYQVFLDGISESTKVGTSVAQLECFDDDGDIVIYKKVSSDSFNVKRDGTVTLSSKLDFEERNDAGINLELGCLDMFPDDRTPRRETWTEVKLEFSIDDANDNPPEFEKLSDEGYVYRIPEDAEIGIALSPSFNVSDKDSVGNNIILRELYLICNSPDPAVKAALSASDLEICDNFRLEYRQIDKGLYSGTFYLEKTLDYEKRPVYISTLVAVDGSGVDSLTSSINVQFQVQDAQDTPPEFTNVGERMAIAEDTPKDTTLIFGVSARDGDTGPDAKRKIEFDIIRDEKDVFSLAPAKAASEPGVYTSNIIIRNELDREISSNYLLVVKAIEMDDSESPPVRSDATATATYTIVVTDVNDNSPLFDKPDYIVSIKELTGIDRDNFQEVQIPGLHITADDKDEPSNAGYEVTILRQSWPQAYSVSPALTTFTGKGSMFLRVDRAEYLDYDVEQYRNQEVVLEAREVNTAERFSSSTIIYITLEDVNDNTPEFVPTNYAITVEESALPGFLVKTLTATDKDSGDNGKVRYYFEGGSSDLFSIGETTGEITLNGQLDYESVQQYVFLVYAEDHALEPKSTQVQLTVNVGDVNDLGPVFSQPSYETSVTESSLTFLNPITITAVDDEAISSVIRYTIIDGQSPNQAFFIDQFTGKLSLTKLLDYQDTPLDPEGNPRGYFLLTVEASDGVQPNPQTNTVEVTVNVLDENNHTPKVQPEVYDKRISEIAPPGTVVADVEATDDDGGSFGKITYRLGPGNSGNFLVNPETGVVTVADIPFDFDQRNSYTIYILATDGGAPQKTGTATVNVDLTDANTKTPSFPLFLYRKNLDESTPVNSEVIQTVADDQDTDANLQYTIIKSSYQASDRFGNSLVITDTVNSNIRETFRIDNDGQIYTSLPLDVDIAQDISFDVQVEDEASETGPQIATTRVAIIVGGEPDSDVDFENVEIAYVNEDREVGYDIGTFTAIDQMTDRTVDNYVTLEAPDFARVEPATGKVILTRTVDYETEPSTHLIVVEASITDSKGRRSATGTMTVSILDANDTKPKFQRSSYLVQRSESLRYPDLVTRILATDADSPSFGPINYRISGGLDADDFQIFQADNDPAAYVIVAEGVELDYNRRDRYVLTIMAVDNFFQESSSTTLTSSVQLTIELIDENNNIPYFKDSDPTFVVPETADITQDIAVIQAFDDDIGLNGDIVYTLEAGASPTGLEALNLFNIQQRSGSIFVQSSLLGRGGVDYQFLVRASDRGEVPNSQLLPVTISVLSTEDDDGNPKWSSPATDFIVKAPEETDNHPLTELQEAYKVVPRTGLDLIFELSRFSDAFESLNIDTNTGLVTIVNGLDREDQEFYEIHVFAVDTNDTAKLRTGRTFIIQLTDKDDNEPTFTNPRNYRGCSDQVSQEVTVFVQENAPANTTVFQLLACDPDSPDNSRVEFVPYEQDDGCRAAMNATIFEVQLDGRLTTTQDVDFEEREQYTLCVLVRSPDNPQPAGLLPNLDQMPNVAVVTVRVTDVNDNKPIFPAKTDVAVVYTSPGTGPVHILDAVDQDGMNFNGTRYQIRRTVFYPEGSSVASLQPSAFLLQTSTGAIFPNLASYVKFAGGRFVLSITAIDMADNTKTDTQTLSIYVYERGETVKLILDLEPEDGFLVAEDLIKALDAVESDVEFSYVSASEHRQDDEIYLDKTDVCFVAVDASDSRVLDMRSVINILNEAGYQAVLSVDKYKFEDRAKCYPSGSSEDEVDWDDLWWVLVAIAIFLFVCCLICIILICILYRNYKRYMETRKTYLVPQ